MLSKFIFNNAKNSILKIIVIGTLTGSILGAFAGFLYKLNISNSPGIGYTLKSSPYNEIITGTVLGIFIGGGISILIGLYLTRDKTPDNDTQMEHSMLHLREEQLDISKIMVQTGEVSIHKETLREEKNIIVPVTREELVIEKKVLNREAGNNNSESTETIRVPISEERIEVIKHPVIQEDIAVSKRTLQETEHIEETLKKEKVHIKTTGDCEILDKKT